MGRPPNGKTTIAGNKSSSLRVSKSVPIKGPSGSGTNSNSSSPSTAGGVGKSTADRSQLNFPYDIRLGGFSSIQNSVNKGTPKIRRILTEECDYIMECRVCRNLFRSLPNFVTHKLNYCKKSFDSTWCIGLSSLVQTTDRIFNIEYEVDPELLIDEKVMSNTNKERPASALYHELANKVQAQRSTDAFEQTSPTSDNLVRLKIKPLPGTGADSTSSSVVLVQRTSSDPSNCDVSNPISHPIDNCAKKDTAILGPDGKIMCTGSSKGIEAIVSRLTAQMKSLEARQATATDSNIACNICKTVFDSEKALRQHKREGLDCGRTWGSKTPAKNNLSSIVKSSFDKSLIPTKKFKPQSDVDHSLHHVNSTGLMPSPKKVGDTVPKVSSPLQSRRCSYKTSQSPNKSKRGLSLSPVKKIKMKYSKLDSSVSSVSEDRRCLSCNNCSSSFNTRHEMSMHLALCNGVINYAFLGESESPREKIRISARNEFGKSSKAEVVKIDRNVNKVHISSISSSVSGAISPLDFQSEQRFFSLSHDGNREPSAGADDLTQKIQQKSNSVGESCVLGPLEVNNNKQYKNENCNSKEVPSDKTTPKKLCPNQNAKVKIGKDGFGLVGVNEKTNISTRAKPQNLTNTDVSTVQVSGISSVSDLRKSAPKLKDFCSDTHATTTTETKAPLKQISPVKTRKSKPSKINLVAQVITRFENTPQRAFNLRKSVSARIRKSRRIPGSTLFKRRRK